MVLRSRKAAFFLGVFFFVFISSTLSFSADLKEDTLVFCKFGPKIQVIASNLTKRAENSCEGDVKVQGVLWQCAPSVQTSTKNLEFRKTLIELGGNECEKFCQTRGEKCHGKFVEPRQCALQSDMSGAAELGKDFGCRADCEGSAFIYCSLYDADYRTDDPPRIAKQAPNCRCVLK